MQLSHYIQTARLYGSEEPQSFPYFAKSTKRGGREEEKERAPKEQAIKREKDRQMVAGMSLQRFSLGCHHYYV